MRWRLFETDFFGFFDIDSQDLPMKNIVFDGVRVLQAENSDMERYHTCKGDMKLNLEEMQSMACVSAKNGSGSRPFHTPHTPLKYLNKIRN